MLTKVVDRRCLEQKVSLWFEKEGGGQRAANDDLT
jgi:hypothetical protein